MQIFILASHLTTIGDAVGNGRAPERSQHLQIGPCFHRAEPANSDQLDLRAKVIQIIEVVEIEWLHLPARMPFDPIQKPVTGQHMQGKAHRRA